MKYLFSNCRRSPVADATGFFLFGAIWDMEIGAKRVDLEKLFQGKKWAYVWNWSKAGRFGEVAPRGKVGICLELEQSWQIWRSCSKPERLLRTGIGVRQAGKKNCSNFGN